MMIVVQIAITRKSVFPGVGISHVKAAFLA